MNMRERRLARLSGASETSREYVKQELGGSPDWFSRCWNCGNRVQGTPKELTENTCPHCGVTLGKRS